MLCASSRLLRPNVQPANRSIISSGRRCRWLATQPGIQTIRYNTAKSVTTQQQYIDVTALPLQPSKQASKFIPASAINTDYYPVIVPEYVLYVAVSIGSLLLGASIVHNIYKPDLHIDLKEYEAKLKRDGEAANSHTAVK